MRRAIAGIPGIDAQAELLHDHGDRHIPEPAGGATPLSTNDGLALISLR